MHSKVKDYRFGIMHGRLTSPILGRIQAFPVEFYLAWEAGLDCIEWIYEVDNEEANPLRTEEGIGEILQLAGETGITVRSLCADYYMDRRLIGPEGAIVEPIQGL